MRKDTYICEDHLNDIELPISDEDQNPLVFNSVLTQHQQIFCRKSIYVSRNVMYHKKHQEHLTFLLFFRNKEECSIE